MKGLTVIIIIMTLIGITLIALVGTKIYKDPSSLDNTVLISLLVGIGLVASWLWAPHIFRLLKTATEITLPGGTTVRASGTADDSTVHTAKKKVTSKPPDQVSALCYSIENSEPKFLLIQTSGHRWLFPKGNMNQNEEPCRAAEREAYEEGGVSGNIDQVPFTRFRHHKRELKSQGVYLDVDVFLLHVTRTQPSREPHRNPTWFTTKEAKAKLAEDREFSAANELKRVIDEAIAKIT
jgi:8-oxo-dGTP pyrophosphatase MutT (NUDIX family)